MVWKMSAWVVREGRWGYVEHFPKIWCGGVECEVRKTHCSEGDRKRKLMEKRKNQGPAKIGLRIFFLVSLVLVGVDR